MWDIIEQNKRKSFFVMLFMFILLGLFGACVGAYVSFDIYGIIFGAVFIIIVYAIYVLIASRNISSLFGNDLYEIDETKDKKLFNIVQEMAIASGLEKTPKIYILDSNILNAFASGTSPKNACVTVSKGLIEILSRDELQGVIAHEIGHIVNRDVLYMFYAGSMVTLISFFTRILTRSSSRRSNNSKSSGLMLIFALIAIILAPIVAHLFYLTLSRKREYLADACAAQYTRYPEGLARALSKISSKNNELINSKKVVGVNDSNPLLNASFIIPLNNSTGDNIFSTHPSTENRIKILLKMSSSDIAEYNLIYQNITKDKSLVSKNILNKSEIIPNINKNSFVNTDEIQEEIKNHREVEDLMWTLSSYTIIQCSCGTKLKIPKCYKGMEISCPHCKKKHQA